MKNIADALTLLATLAEPLTRIVALHSAVSKTIATASAAGRDLTDDEMAFIRAGVDGADERWQGVLAKLRAAPSAPEDETQS